jgi:putative intracellular protease/amidase
MSAPERRDQWDLWGQLAMLKFLTANGCATHQELPILIDAKNRVVRDFRLIASEEEISAEEFTKTLHAALLQARRIKAAA